MRVQFMRLIAAFALVLIASACTPKAALLSALLPQNAVNVVLGNLERVPDENRRRVAELEKAGRWSDLAGLAEAELSKDRANADWWLIAGYANSQLGKHRRAAEAYDEVVRLEPDNAAGWHLLAQSHRAAGAPERAVRILERARYALRDSPLTPYLLGESYSDLQRYDLAVPAYRDALRIEERFPAAWFALAMSYARLGRTSEARAAELRLEKLDPAAAGRLRGAMASMKAEP
jgi:tetratricopeptide (TPR) repeat protein